MIPIHFPNWVQLFPEHFPKDTFLRRLPASMLSLEPLEPHIMRHDAFSEEALGGNIIALHNLGSAVSILLPWRRDKVLLLKCFFPQFLLFVLLVVSPSL